MVIVGLDVGEARIGVAVSDDSETLASPRGVVRRRSNAAAIAEIARIVRESDAQLVVVGLPISFDGKLHAQARTVQAFGNKLRAALGVPLVYSDETLSTVRAEERLRAAGVRPERMRERIDAAAAAVILQDYLDRPTGAASTPERQVPADAGPAADDATPGGQT